jgi:hypothetical protein
MGVRTGLGAINTRGTAPAGGAPSAPAKAPPDQQPAPDVAAQASGRKKRAEAASAAPDDRRGWLVRLTPAQRHACGEFCFQRDVSQQDMILRGLDMVLKAEGMRPLPDYQPVD